MDLIWAEKIVKDGTYLSDREHCSKLMRSGYKTVFCFPLFVSELYTTMSACNKTLCRNEEKSLIHKKSGYPSIFSKIS